MCLLPLRPNQAVLYHICVEGLMSAGLCCVVSGTVCESSWLSGVVEIVGLPKGHSIRQSIPAIP